jgi:hypothetical protein
MSKNEHSSINIYNIDYKKGNKFKKNDYYEDLEKNIIATKKISEDEYIKNESKLSKEDKIEILKRAGENFKKRNMILSENIKLMIIKQITKEYFIEK